MKPEALYGPDGKAVAAKFTHGNGGGASVDKLTFTLSDGQRYEWRSNHPVSTVGGYRYDFQCYALFRVAGAGLQLVADDAPWNGDLVENAEALTIRVQDVDHAMVMAMLQMMKDAQWEVLRAETRNDSKVVKKTVEQARKTEMGKLVYWYRKDFTGEAEGFGFELGVGIVSAALGG